jgi:hypothetical protein
MFEQYKQQETEETKKAKTSKPQTATRPGTKPVIKQTVPEKKPAVKRSDSKESSSADDLRL